MKLLTQFEVGAILTLFKAVARPKQHDRTVLHFDSRVLCENFRTPKHVVGGQTGPGIVGTSLRSNAERGFFLPLNRAWSTDNASARHRKHGHCDLITGWLKNGGALFLRNYPALLWFTARQAVTALAGCLCAYRTQKRRAIPILAIFKRSNPALWVCCCNRLKPFQQ